jgi:hypothetical protein
MSASLDDPLHRAKAGIELRERGDHAAAEAIFQALIERFPHSVYGWQEMGVLQAMRGQAQEALRLFAQAVDCEAAGFLTRRHLVLQQVKLGLIDDAERSLRAHPPGPPPVPGQIAVLEDFVAFVHAFPQERGVQLARSFEFGGHWLEVRQVEQRIFDALAAGAPLSFIRLGDGEGAWLPVDRDDEARFARLYEANRRDTLQVWFGHDGDYGRASFMATRERLRLAVDQADIIGIPYPARMAHEYRVASVRGVSACVNIMRCLNAARDGGRGAAYCSHDMHLELHLGDFFRRLAAMGVTFGVISCHPELGYRLVKAFGAKVVRMVVVPEEMGFTKVDPRLSPITGISGMTESHFPLAFDRITMRLAAEGGAAQVWLVAAGYLGKLYCDTIRSAGSIALDVGSIVDGWCGTVTRPYLEKIEQFRL